MSKDQIAIVWSEAEELFKQQKADEIQRAKKYAKKVQKAKINLFEKLGFESFRYSDFEDSCANFGIETDDLLNALI